MDLLAEISAPAPLSFATAVVGCIFILLLFNSYHKDVTPVTLSPEL
jgi:hypothetical protein